MLITDSSINQTQNNYETSWEGALLSDSDTVDLNNNNEKFGFDYDTAAGDTREPTEVYRKFTASWKTAETIPGMNPFCGRELRNGIR